jgi:hypothetical protein
MLTKLWNLEKVAKKCKVRSENEKLCEEQFLNRKKGNTNICDKNENNYVI